MTTPRARGLVALTLLLVALAGCRDRKPKPPDIAEVFPNLPVPPLSRFVGSSGGEDAMQLTFASKASQEQVEAYYKHVFSGGGWRLVSRAKAPDGALVMLAEQDGPPLWVRIRAEGSGSTVDLSGARASREPAGVRPAGDSAARPGPQS